MDKRLAETFDKSTGVGEKKTFTHFLQEGFKLTSDDRFSQFNLKLAPWGKWIASCYDNKECDWLYLQMSSQVSKTTIMMGFLLYISQYVRGAVPSLWVHSTGEEAKKFANKRLKPMLTQESKKDLGKGKSFYINNALLDIANAYTQTSIKTDPKRFIFGDECAIWRQSIEYVKLRARTFFGLCFGMFGTTAPDNPEHHISKEFQVSDLYLWFVPCPHCNFYQNLVFSQLKWSGKKDNGRWDVVQVRKTAHYECIRCKGKIYDKDKVEIINKGQARCVDNETKLEKEPEGYRSRRLIIWAAYSPFATFGEIAELFITAKMSGWLAIRTFTTDQLAESPEKIAAKKKKEYHEFEVLKVKDRKLGQIIPAHIYSLGIDVQRTGKLYCSVWGYIGGSLISGHLIDCKEINWKGADGKPDWTELIKWASLYKHVLFRALIDATDGVESQNIKDFCTTAGHPFYPVIDLGMKQKDKQKIDKKLNRDKTDLDSMVYNVNTSYVKTDLSGCLDRLPGQNGVWTFPEDTPKEFFIHLSNEVPVDDIYQGKSVIRWVKKYTDAPQHWFSTSVYALAAIEQKRTSLLQTDKSTRFKNKVEKKLSKKTRGVLNSGIKI